MTHFALITCRNSPKSGVTVRFAPVICRDSLKKSAITGVDSSLVDRSDYTINDLANTMHLQEAVKHLVLSTLFLQYGTQT